MTLFDECLEALQNNYKIFPDKQKKQFIEEVFEIFPLTDWGKIDWKKVKIDGKCTYNENFIDSIINFFGDNNLDVMIVWDEVNHRILISNLVDILRVIDDITAVSFDTWIISKDKEKIVEFYHDGNITYGTINKL